MTRHWPAEARKRDGASLDNLRPEARNVQHEAFFYVLAATEKPVDRAYNVWSDLYTVVEDETLRERALALFETEEDAKYRKKYAGLWKTK